MKIIFTILVLVLSNYNVLATWSIMIIDPDTKEIGIAGASCTPNCYGIGKIIPGTGAIIVQAMSNGAARDEGVELILSGKSPQEIIAALQDDIFDPQRQQYTIMTLKHFETPATFTGKLTHDFKGTLTGNGFSIQGNTLTGENVLEAIYNAVVEGKKNGLRIDRILMLALEAGSLAGGDSRCGNQTATSAFITVASPGDKKPYMTLQIFKQAKGGPNAVTMLRKKYEKWIIKQ